MYTCASRYAFDDRRTGTQPTVHAHTFTTKPTKTHLCNTIVKKRTKKCARELYFFFARSVCLFVSRYQKAHEFTHAFVGR